MRHNPFGKRPLLVAALALLCLSACKGNSALSSSSGLPPLQPQVSSKKIQHVIIIIQENRSFNNLFYGYPGAKTVSFGLTTKNQKVALKPISLATGWDLQHDSQGFELACNGTGKIPGTDCLMNGFNKEYWGCDKPNEPKCPKGVKYPPYAYVPHAESAPYFSMAHQYVLADQMYASNFDASSFVSHQYIIAGQASSSANYPESYWGCPGGKPDKVPKLLKNRGIQTPGFTVCFDNRTLGDELDNAKLPWAFYTYPIETGSNTPPNPCTGSGDGDVIPDGSYHEKNSIWSAYQAIRHICYGPDWSKDVITDSPRFLTDVAKGDLRAVTWITPTCANSDHAGCGVPGKPTGPSWVASLVNGVGESKFWSTSAIFVFWDDYGGWYDSAKPQYLDNDGLGGRIPMLIISPYAKKGFVDDTPYEHGSILRFIENNFALGQLAASDNRATPPDAAFNFSQRPRKFVPIKASYDASHFIHEVPDRRPPDTE